MKPEDERFVEKFGSYLHWVADGEPSPEKPRTEMLEAFSHFLSANNIPREQAKDFETKMQSFAKGGDKRDP